MTDNEIVEHDNSDNLPTFDFLKFNLPQNMRVDKNHLQMMQDIESQLPSLKKDLAVFGRRQSQMMDSALILSHPTPIRNLRQILAEMQRAWSSLVECFYDWREKDATARLYERQADDCDYDEEREILLIKSERIRSQISNSSQAVSGAIRKMRFLMEQKQNILSKLGKEHITEQDFEEDEARYHVGKAFQQALCAARARNGVIDEGNHIYFSQIGINGALAQMEVHHLLAEEGRCIKEGRPIPQDLTHRWLESMMNKYHGCIKEEIEMRGLISEVVKPALLLSNDEDK